MSSQAPFATKMMMSYDADDDELGSKIMIYSFVWVLPSIITNKQTNRQGNKQIFFGNYSNPESAQAPFATKMTLIQWLRLCRRQWVPVCNVCPPFKQTIKQTKVLSELILIQNQLRPHLPRK